jgi:tetratricopeptide (TPR) repeat protein
MAVDLKEALEEHQRGNLERATRLYEVVLRGNPDHPDALYLLGLIAIQTGNPQRAVLLIGRAATLRPGDPVIHANLGEAYRALGDTKRTIECCRTALRLDPEHPDVHFNLALALVSVGELETAASHYREVIRLKPGFAAAHYGLGKIYQSLGQLDEAKSCFVQSTKLDPSQAASHAELAHVWEQLGEFDRALRSLREALNCDHRHPGALARLATRLRENLSQADEATIESLLADPNLPAEPRLQLQFGLAQALDARGDFERAAELTMQANNLQLADFHNRGLVYVREAHHGFIDRLIAAFTPAFFQRVRGYGVDSERPVFIVGLPRSGTSLTEQILASHPQVFGAGELKLARQIFETLPGASRHGGMPLDSLYALDRETVQHLAHHYIDELAAINDSTDRIVDKMPDNSVFLGLIATVFPRAKLIHCRRDVRDVALSCWMTNFLDVRWACDPDQIATRIKEHNRLMQHWRRVLPVPMLDLDYEALVADLETNARALVAWCGLNWEPACLHFHKTRRQVRTSSVEQVRQPVYNSSVGRWKNYQQSLASLFAHLHSEV